MSFCRPPWAGVAALWSEVSEMGYWAGGGRSLGMGLPGDWIRDRVRSSAGHWEQKGKENHGETKAGGLVHSALGAFINHVSESWVRRLLQKGNVSNRISHLTSSSYK